MAELLHVVADAVLRCGGRAACVEGTISDASDADAFVVIPHEYFVLTGAHDSSLLARTIGFGVEHPGTATFSALASAAGMLGGNVAIGADAVAELRRRNIPAERFQLGLSPVWDHRHESDGRDIDLVYLGTADERRLRALALVLPDLARFQTEVLLPPHEPMTQPRADFVMGPDKWRLLARSRMLLNLHREGSTAFEWVRALEAISNDCAILTAPSTGIAPLVPGEHVLVAPVPRMAEIATAALDSSTLLEDLAREARAWCEAELDMVASAARLVDLATSLVERTQVAASVFPVRRVAAAASERAPMAHWLPQARALPVQAVPVDRAVADAFVELDELRRAAARAVIAHPRARGAAVHDERVDVVCVRRSGDGPLAATLATLDTPRTCVHVAYDGVPTTSRIDADTVISLSHPVGRGAARNRLIAQGAAPYVLVLDSGDEVLEEGVGRMISVLEDEPDMDIAFPLAVHGSDLVVNAMVPEVRRLRATPYLTRGYMVRRRWLEDNGGFAEESVLDDWVDHEFWLRSAGLGARVRHIRSVGIRLWPQHPAPSPSDFDPAALRRRLEETSAASSASDRPDHRHRLGAARSTQAPNATPHPSGRIG